MNDHTERERDTVANAIGWVMFGGEEAPDDSPVTITDEQAAQAVRAADRALQHLEHTRQAAAVGDATVPPSPVYLAARYSRRDELNGYRATLESLGYTVQARWLDGEHTTDFDRSTAQGADDMARFAAEDLDDVMAAGTVVCFTEQPRQTNTRGGRHVEFGVALARQRLRWNQTGCPTVLVVGPLENVFVALAARFETFDELLEAMR